MAADRHAVARAVQQVRDSKRHIEARDRALRQIERRLRDIDHALQRHNYGDVSDGLEALRADLGTEFGSPYIVTKEYELLP